ncbi:class I SAM-dependent DNA methyltransferase [Azospirillum isscasi]|uniref:Class I SAM-dependent methyltransferase n=1 Tax=Azospirillum isscasi TaxID=3053926 RepID=A0ABU0WR82_9PROT|nr:class I SAM-dependent methyltransferase [Azospirillum isscasi]MDQ2106433.1 class I SAM-dependent methyltransferase [Azospirillum isscasi]
MKPLADATYDGQPVGERGRYTNLDIEYIRQRWDLRAERWASDLGDPSCHLNRDNSYSLYLDAMLATLERLPQPIPGGVVDLGCGTGEMLYAVRDRFPWSTGIDISPRMLDLARTRLGTGSMLIEGNVFEADCIPAGCSAIISRGVLLSHYGAENGLTLLKILRGRILDAGILILDALNKEDPDLPHNKTGYGLKELAEMAAMSWFSRVELIAPPTRSSLFVAFAP